jgi:hypothetical protein
MRKTMKESMIVINGGLTVAGLLVVVGAAVMDNCSKNMFILALACCVYTSLNLIVLLSIKDE